MDCQLVFTRTCSVLGEFARNPVYRLSSLWLTALVMVVASGCTTVGRHTSAQSTVDYGPPLTLNVCVLQAPGVSDERADELVGAVNKEFTPYNITVAVPWRRSWNRAGFFGHSLMDDVAHRDIEAPCDRLVALVDRNPGDFFWGMLGMGDVVASVDSATHTHGFVVATEGSLTQLFFPPSEGAVNESYALLGCNPAHTLTACYHQIGQLKAHTKAADGFVPGTDGTGKYFQTRAEVNARLKVAVTERDLIGQQLTLEQRHELEWTADCASKGTVSLPAMPKPEPSGFRRSRVLVCSCVDDSGYLTQDVVITDSSGVPKIDAAAVKLSTASSGLYTLDSTHDKAAGNCQRTSMIFKYYHI